MEQLMLTISDLWEIKPVRALIIIILFALIGKILSIVIQGIIGRIVKKTKTDLDDKLFDIFSFPIFLTIFLVGLGLAIALLEINIEIQQFFQSMIKTIIILHWSYSLLKCITVFLNHFGKKPGRKRYIQKRTIPLFNNLLKLLLLISTVYFIFIIWNINITGWIASAGIIGIAVGFAAKDSLANLFSGIFIIVDAPYKLGDFITLDSGERGEVNMIGLRSTRILTMDSVEITIPNSVMANTKITNENGGPSKKNRLKIMVGVAYGSDLDQVKEVMKDVAIQNENVCDDPEPNVRLVEFADSSLNMQLLCWISKSAMKGIVSDQLNSEIYKTFNRNRIEIPFPQMDLNFRNLLIHQAEKGLKNGAGSH